MKLGSKYEIIRRIKQKEEEIVNARRKEKKEEEVLQTEIAEFGNKRKTLC